MAKTKIEWADRVWNPVTGCTKISPGCANCYAERMAKRLSGRCGYPDDEPFRVTMHGDKINEPLYVGKAQRYFVCSMGDLFHTNVLDSIIYNIFAVMADTPRHTYMVLTKRPERMQELLGRPNKIWSMTTYNDYPGAKKPWPLPNVWLGVTAENQEMADKRIPILLQIPATVRFVSCEPLLGPVDLAKACDVVIGEGDNIAIPAVDGINKFLHWVICGGETGPGARPMHPDWVRSLRDQCQAASVPFFFKQWGEWGQLEGSGAGAPTPICYWNDESEKWVSGLATHTQNMVRIGKKKAGRMLDGQLWNLYPVG